MNEVVHGDGSEILERKKLFTVVDESDGEIVSYKEPQLIKYLDKVRTLNKNFKIL